MMKKRALWWLIVAALAFVPASVRVQEGRYPIEIVPPGKGPFTFPAGYQTPWDRIQIFVTAKMSPNLFVLHGSEGLDPAHPEASGGRAMALRRAARSASDQQGCAWGWETSLRTTLSMSPQVQRLSLATG